MSDKKGWFVLVNPAANASMCGAEWKKVKTILDRKSWDYTYKETEYTRHAVELTTDAIEAGYRKILAVGGTGTCNEVTNGIMLQTVVPSQDIIFANIQLGSIDPWSKHYDIPRNYERWLDEIDEDCYHLQDVGLVKYHLDGIQLSHYFINISSLLFGAHVANQSMGNEVVVFNRLRFINIIARSVFNYKNQNVTIRYNDKSITDHFFNVNIGICKFTAERTFQILPHAVSDSGLLSINHDIGKMKLWDRLVILLQLARNRYAVEKRIHLDKAPTFTLVPNENATCLLETDGEFLGYAPVEYSIVPKALKVLVPKSFKNK